MHGPTSGADLGVYIHVPFCDRVCPYCDFAVEASGALDPQLAHAYVDDLLRELELRIADADLGLLGRPLATAYLGGGTPSLLPADEVARLLDALAAAFGPLPDEVTLELNPGPLEVERLAAFRDAG